MNRHITFHFYSIIRKISPVLGVFFLTAGLYGGDLWNDAFVEMNTKIDSAQADSLALDSILTDTIVYPGKPLLKSLIIPGWGQYDNKAPLWKILTFASIEIGSILSAYHFTNLGESSQLEYENFADDYWTLEKWYIFTQSHTADLGQYGIKLTGGSHALQLFLLTDSLVNVYGNNFISSNEIDGLYESIANGDVKVVRDHHFYENVGKYNQFTGGWSDVDEYDLIEKAVSDTSIEMLVMTDLKDDYLNMRFDSNQFKLIAKYSVTALMFNHIFAGLEAVLFAQKKSKILQNTKVSLFYNPQNRNGLGGLSLTMVF
ncbi:MAG: hypothetical protein HN657_07420 [Candidatus Marinimicrobia bacterium]|jgi:hypothetical protein|nr:hypothetical protein [Candidatus Neomarinimicrobiota bacterium]MBT3496064.1 hypothetical protein [Candidatus Neomarinimicrobiota bacterium]MBT3692498.1 hypothetical protein [Candidatus Neomarinimicrobiota bacterium]MBT3732979.1 hypothetical protein [Candidatus Neomarinimicrobiota bacterium]MBT4144089.1 hypothetical protein [Candidatus Neomarinimicrobiota bacterium]